MNLITLITGILLAIWGISAFALIIKLDKEKFHPNSKVWKLIGLDKERPLLLIFWFAFIILGVFFGIFGFAITVGELL